MYRLKADECKLVGIETGTIPKRETAQKGVEDIVSSCGDTR